MTREIFSAKYSLVSNNCYNINRVSQSQMASSTDSVGRWRETNWAEMCWCYRRPWNKTPGSASSLLTVFKLGQMLLDHQEVSSSSKS